MSKIKVGDKIQILKLDPRALNLTLNKTYDVAMVKKFDFTIIADNGQLKRIPKSNLKNGRVVIYDTVLKEDFSFNTLSMADLIAMKYDYLKIGDLIENTNMFNLDKKEAENTKRLSMIMDEIAQRNKRLFGN